MARFLRVPVCKVISQFLQGEDMRFKLVAAFVSVVGIASFASAANRVDLVSQNTPTIANPVKLDPAISYGGLEALPYSAGGFEGFSAGALTGQNSWTVDPGTDNYTVSATGGVSGTKGVRVGGGATNWGYPTTTAYTPGATDIISINADIARTVGTASASSSFGYLIDVYNSATARTFRFGLGVNASNQPALLVTSHWSAALGFNPAAPVANVLISTGLTPGTFYNLEARANYVAKTFDLYSNNVLVQGGMPFAALTHTDFSDADVQVSSAANLADAGFYDNYSINVLQVPEPTTLGALAGLSVLATRRRSR
jgi:hypothetical protein